MNICSVEAKLRHTFYIGHNFEHVLSPFPRHFVCSFTNRLSNYINCIKVSEIMREIFRYVTYVVILSRFARLAGDAAKRTLIFELPSHNIGLT